MKQLRARWSGGFRDLRRLQGGWVQLLWFVVTLVLSIALSPKPPKPRPAALEDFDVPVAQEDRPIPVLFGTKRITGANVTWYGDLSTRKIKKGGLLGSTTVGHKYFLGFQIALGLGPFDKITKIEVADQEAWSGSVTDNTTIEIDKPELFGGKGREGGLVGDVDVEFGASTQSVNSYLADKQGTPTPAYRGVTTLVWKTGFRDDLTRIGYVGNTPYVKPWAVTATRITSGWTNDSPWYPAAAAIGTAMNPAHIIYQCLTDIEWGMGASSSSIDEDSFQDAADTLLAEEFGLNMLWNQATSIESFIGIVLDHIAGILAFDQSTGKYLLKLVRADYDEDALETFDPSNIIEVQNFERRSWGETVNELTLSFTDAVTRKPTAMVVQDLGNIAAQSVRINEKLDFSGIDDVELMRTVAGRELAARSTPLARMDLITDRTLWRYGPGDVIKIRWPQYELDTTVFRILSLSRGTLRDGKMAVNVIEDIYGLPGIEYVDEQSAPDEPTRVETPFEPNGNPNVRANNLSAPPADPEDGDRYYIPVTPAPTGDWAGHGGELAEWDEDGEEWIFVEVPGGTTFYNDEDGEHFFVDEYGAISDAPWTPAIAPLTEDEDPELANLMLVAYDTTSETYKKVRGDNVGSGGGDIVNAGINLSMFHPGVPTSSKLMFQFTIPDNWMLPGDMADSVGHIGTNPTAEFVMDVNVNGSGVGTITVDTDGAFTFETTDSNAVELIAGDKLTIVAPSSTDATAADISVTLVTFTEILASGNPSRISFGFFFPGTPAGDQLIAKTIFARSLTFAANFSTAFGDVGTNPTSTFVVTLSLNGADVGTATISTGGAFTFASTGGVAIAAQAGDVLELEAQSSTDATIADIGLTLVASLP